MNLRKRFARSFRVAVCGICLFCAAFSQQTPLTPAQELAKKLAALNGDSERRALLDQSKDWQTVDLRKALLAEGSRFRIEGDYDKARAINEFTRQFAERIGDQLGAAHAVNNIGSAFQEQGENNTALEYFNKSLELMTALKNQPGIANVSNNIGLGYSYMGDYSRAQEYLEKSLKIFEELDRKDMMPYPLNNLGIVQRRIGNLARSQEYYERSLRLYEEAKNKFGATLALNNLANLKSDTGDYAAALEYNRKSLALSEELGNKKGIAIALSNLGTSYLRQDDFAKAFEYYEKSLKIDEEIKNKVSLAVDLTNLANVKLNMDRSAEALEYAKRAEIIAREINSEELLWKSFKLEGEAFARLKQSPKARLAFDSAIKIIESRRFQLSAGVGTQNYFSDKLAPYQETVKLLVEQNDAAGALDYAEHAKARALLDILSSAPVETGKSMNAAEITREGEINSKIALLNRQILIERARQPPPEAARLKQLESDLETTRLDYEAFRAELYAAHPTLQAQRGEAKIISPFEIADTLLKEPNKALLEYVVTDEATYLIVIAKAKNRRAKSPIEISVHKIAVTQSDLAKRTESFRQAIATRDEYKPAARALYDTLVAPAELELKGKTKIVVVPDGTLWNLPFQALLTGQNRFLLENYNLSYAPSLTALREMKEIERRHAANSGGEKMLLALGNPMFDVDGEAKAKPAILRFEAMLAPLPDAETEVKSLGDLYGAAQSEIYVKEEAREDRVKAVAGRFKILQFATHSVFNDANPLYSYLLLSPNPAGGDDGLLEARELMNLNLSADLVVLSACETARGRVSAGEGLVGMTWALFVSGVPATVASQWKVPSAATTEIMLGFHRNLHNKKKSSDTAEALRQAELDYLRKATFQHPFYWAGFVLIGND